jgi:hypothetical protein
LCFDELRKRENRNKKHLIKILSSLLCCSWCRRGRSAKESGGESRAREREREKRERDVLFHHFFFFVFFFVFFVLFFQGECVFVGKKSRSEDESDAHSRENFARGEEDFLLLLLEETEEEEEKEERECEKQQRDNS